MDISTIPAVANSTPVLANEIPEACQSGSRCAECSCSQCQRRGFARRATALQPILSQYLRRYVRNPDDVLELMQETYVRLLGPSGRCGSTYTSPLAMILTVARHVAIDWLRRQALVAIEPRGNLDALDIVDESADCEMQIDMRQRLALIEEAVKQMPTRCRQAFTLRKVYGCSQKEIALRLGISENTVEQHLSKAMQRLVETVPDLVPTHNRLRRNRRLE